MRNHFILGILLLLATSSSFSSQDKPSENQKLEALCKIWGFLKYYHPTVATGIYDWDAELIKIIKESEATSSKKQFNTMIFNWIKQLGKLEKCKECNQKTDKIYFLKNFDLSWTDDTSLFTQPVIKLLDFIENNRNLQPNYYYIYNRENSKRGVQNENFSTETFPSKDGRLLELFRYWNLIEYFFPYKYQTDQKWNSVLTEMLPKFRDATIQKEYSLATLELLAKTDDSHVSLKNSDLTYYLGGHRVLPIETQSAEDQLVVTQLYNTIPTDTLALQKHDVIIEINGERIPDLVKKHSKYVAASNPWGKLRKIKNLILWSNAASIQLKIKRNGLIQTVDAKTFLSKDVIRTKTPQHEKWNFLDSEKTIGFVNIGAIEVADIDEMFQQFRNTKAIIFDVRHYPKLTTQAIASHLLPNVVNYYSWLRPDLQYPGKFFEDKGFVGQENPNNYKGTVIALINETTQSQAETLTMMLKQHPNCTVIGSNSSGANGNVVKLKIMNAETSYSGLGAFYPDGKETQRIGLIPDIEVKPTVKGIIENRDELLECALRTLQN